jgi:CBS domain-containing protein
MKYHALPTSRHPDGTFIAQTQPPRQDAVTLDSPALAVMTDLTEVRAATVHPRASLAHAEAKMIHQGVRMLFVVSEMPGVEGIVTAADLQGEASMRLVHERHVRHDELSVEDVMTRLSELETVEYSVLARASVGDVAATLQKFGRGHLLVTEQAKGGGQPRIRGLVSHTQVERQLGAPLPALAVATTFAEIEKALH